MDNTYSDEELSPNNYSSLEETNEIIQCKRDFAEYGNYEDVLDELKSLFEHAFDQTNNIENIFKNLLEQSLWCMKEGINLSKSHILEHNEKTSNTHLILQKHINDCVMLCRYICKHIKDGVQCFMLSCEEFPEVPLLLGHIVLLLFTHCNQSESIYKSFLRDVESELKILFVSCNDVHHIYMAMLQEHYTFDLEIQKQSQVYNEVISILVNIGKVVIELNVKTMAEHWKTFVCLCKKNSDHIEHTKPILGQTVCSLSKVIATYIDSVVVNNRGDVMSKEKQLKITSFLIKIQCKIIDVVKIYLDNATVDSLRSEIFLIYRYNELSIENSALSCQYRTYILIPSYDLLHHLVHIDQFAQSLWHMDLQSDETQLSYILIMLEICQIYIKNKNDDIKSIWLQNNQNNNLIIRILQRSDDLIGDWLWSNIKLNNEHTLYESLVKNITMIITTTDMSIFHLVENIMVKYIMQPDSRATLLVLDIWIILAKFLSQVTLVEQIDFFISVLKQYNVLETTPTYIYVQNILRQLYKQLDDEYKLDLNGRYSIEENLDIWIIIGFDNLPDRIKNTVECNISRQLTPYIQSLENGHFHSKKLSKLLEMLMALSTFEKLLQINITDIINVWRKLFVTENISILITHEECLNEGYQWYNQFVLVLIQIAKKKYLFMDSPHIHEIFTVLHSVIRYSNSSLKLATLSLLYRLAFHDDLNHSTLDKILQVFGELALQDSFISEKTLQTLLLFSIYTKYDYFVQQLKVSNATRILKNYINNLGKRVLDCEMSFKHKCKSTNIVDINLMEDESLKKEKLDIIEKSIFKLEENLKLLTPHINTLSNGHIEKLKFMCTMFTDLLN